MKATNNNSVSSRSSSQPGTPKGSMAMKTLLPLQKKSKQTMNSTKASLIFPVSRIGRFMKSLGLVRRIPMSARVFLTAVVEYLVSDVFEGVTNVVALSKSRKRVSPRHIQQAIQQDDCLAKLFGHVIVASGGYIPKCSEMEMENMRHPPTRATRKSAQPVAEEGYSSDEYEEDPEEYRVVEGSHM